MMSMNRTYALAVLLCASSIRGDAAEIEGPCPFDTAKRCVRYTETTQALASFQDALGVCAHVTVYTGTYKNKEEVLKQLAYLNITKVRDDVRGPFEKMLATYEYLGRRGVTFDVIVGMKRVPDPFQYVDELEKLAPYLDAVEGPNEVDNLHRRVDFNDEASLLYESALAYQKDLYEAVKSSPDLRHLPVFSFTTVMAEHAGALRDLIREIMRRDEEPIADYEAIHAYDRRGEGPERGIRKYIEIFTKFAGMPKVLTETGYTTIVYSKRNKKKGGRRGVPPDIAARLTLNTLFDAYRWGMKRIYLYQLQDDIEDRAHTDKEFHFGLFDFDGAPKPAAVALHNMQAVMKGSGPVDPQTLDFWVHQTNAREAFDFARHHLLFKKDEGTLLLAVWAEPILWDGYRHEALERRVAGNRVTLGFSKAFKGIEIYDPLQGGHALRTLKDAATVDIEVTDHPVFVVMKD